MTGRNPAGTEDFPSPAAPDVAYRQQQCSFGTSPATFAASDVQVSATSPAGVVTDVGSANVPPFGMCMSLANPQVASATAAASNVLTPQPCVPVLAPWTPGAQDVMIGDVAALDDSSQCQCT